MARRFYDLPPLTALAAFEAVARHLSVKNAAAELNVTPGAVSHQIRALEGELGLALFRRIHRGLELTPDGAELFAVLAQAFGQTAATIDRLRRRGQDQSVMIGATTAMASLWLMPRLPVFWRRHPEVRVDQQISDSAADLGTPQVDLWIRYLRTPFAEDGVERMFGDLIQPVASPDLAAAHPDLSAGTLHRMPLIRLTGVDPTWTDWEEWFRLAGLPLPTISGPRCNSYSIALQAAQDGAGVVLGWRRLIEPLIAAGRLVPVTGRAVPSPGAYHLVRPLGRGLSASAALLRDWLMAEAAALADTGESRSTEPEFFAD